MSFCCSSRISFPTIPISAAPYSTYVGTSEPRKSKKRTWHSGKSRISLRPSSSAWQSKPIFFNSASAPSNVLPFGSAMVTLPASPAAIIVLLAQPPTLQNALLEHLRPDNALDTSQITVHTSSPKMLLLAEHFLHCRSLLPPYFQQ